MTNSYHDPRPIFDIVVQAQRYYEQHSCSTRVKACAAVNVEQILKLAGVHAFTAPADQLRELSAMDEPAAKVAQRSVFRTEMAAEHTNGDTNGDAAAITNGDANGVTNGNTNGNTNGVTDGASKGTMEKLSFIDDESKFRLAFARADEGRAQLKTAQVREFPPLLSSCFGFDGRSR